MFPAFGGFSVLEVVILPFVVFLLALWFIGVPALFYFWARRVAVRKGRRPGGWSGWAVVGALPLWLSVPGLVIMLVLYLAPAEDESLTPASYSIRRR